MNWFDAIKHMLYNHNILHVCRRKADLAIYAMVALLAGESHATDSASKKATVQKPASPPITFSIRPATPLPNYLSPSVNNRTAGSTPMMIAPNPQPKPQTIPSLAQTPFCPASSSTPYISSSPAVAVHPQTGPTTFSIRPATPSITYFPSTVNNHTAGSTPMMAAPNPQPKPQTIPSLTQTPFCPAQSATPIYNSAPSSPVWTLNKPATVPMPTSATYQAPIQQPPAYQISEYHPTVPTPQAMPSHGLRAIQSYQDFPAPSVPQIYPLAASSHNVAHSTPARIAVQQPQRIPMPMQPVAQPVATQNPYAGMRTIYPLSPAPVGKKIGSGQCTDYAATRFVQASGQARDFHGDAQNWFVAASKNWRTLPSTSTDVPPGSVAVYDNHAGGGHVAVVEENLNGGIVFSEQNWPIGSRVKTIIMTPDQYKARGKYDLLGFIVPVRLDQDK